MGNLDDAFKRGREAHQDAQRAKNEIFALFARLSSTVSEGTQGKVVISYVQLSRTKEAPRNLLAPFAGFLEETERYNGLVAQRTGGNHGDKVELCTVKVSPLGYPVQITFPGQFFTADDLESLERVVIALLEHPDTAGKIDRLAQIEVG
jgi:hypothetical protein